MPASGDTDSTTTTSKRSKKRKASPVVPRAAAQLKVCDNDTLDSGSRTKSTSGGGGSGKTPASSSPSDVKPSPSSSFMPSPKTATAPSSGSTKSPSDKSSPTSNPYDSIKYAIVSNDRTQQNLIRLVGLKTLFAKQLPKMPKDYIARLVFDRRHTSLALLSPNPAHKNSDAEIIGGICYRAYPEMRFAEIAFCAVSASQQVKGYGTKLMNLLKKHCVSEHSGIEYFITYADNYAIGYFKKQGFTKSIAMSKSRFHGLIKDYDGGTMMECYVHPSVDFTRVTEAIKAQREFLMSRVRVVAKSHNTIYPPLKKGWAPNLEGVSRLNESAVRALSIPGVMEAGWTLQDFVGRDGVGGGKDANQQKVQLRQELLSLVRKTEEQSFAWPFREPVDIGEVPDYLDIIKEPIDLGTIEKRIKKGDWYKSKQMLHADLVRMVDNCKTYNDQSSSYYECAENLEKFLPTIFPDL